MTGATGFVGQALCARLQRHADVQVCAAVRRAGQAVLPIGVTPVLVGDLAQVASPWPGLEGARVVVHLAARAHVMHERLADPLAQYRRVNVEGTVNLARQAAQAGVRRFVFISSIKVNGEATLPGQAFTPADTPAPQDAYGLSKHEAEQALWQIAQATGMEVVVIRPPLVYGPGVKGNFARMVQWVRQGLPLPLGAVHNRRSLVAIDNLVDLIALCASPEHSPQATNQTFMVADGDDVSTTELLRRVAHAYGKPARLLPVPTGLMRGAAHLLGKAAAADRLLSSLQVDASKALDLLGWIPPTSMGKQLQKMAQYDARL